MKDQVLEWIGKSQVNPLIVIGAAIVVVVLILILLRRRAGNKARNQAAARIRATRNDLGEVFEGYRESHPAFYSVITRIHADRRLEEFMSNTEFAGAIAKLRLWQAVRVGVKPTKQSASSRLTIQPSSNKPNHEMRAAMITVLRILYTSPEVSQGLPKATEEDLDKLLESLTG